MFDFVTVSCYKIINVKILTVYVYDLTNIRIKKVIIKYL